MAVKGGRRFWAVERPQAEMWRAWLGFIVSVTGSYQGALSRGWRQGLSSSKDRSGGPGGTAGEAEQSGPLDPSRAGVSSPPPPGREKSLEIVRNLKSSQLCIT